MSAISHYSFTVIYKGKCFFTTDPVWGHHLTKKEAEDRFWMFTAKFPKSDGYDVEMTHWDCSGHPMLNTKGK